MIGVSYVVRATASWFQMQNSECNSFIVLRRVWFEFQARLRDVRNQEGQFPYPFPNCMCQLIWYASHCTLIPRLKLSQTSVEIIQWLSIWSLYIKTYKTGKDWKKIRLYLEILWGYGVDWAGSEQIELNVSCEHGNEYRRETSSLSNFQPLKQGCTQRSWLTRGIYVSGIDSTWTNMNLNVNYRQWSSALRHPVVLYARSDVSKNFLPLSSGI